MVVNIKWKVVILLGVTPQQ